MSAPKSFQIPTARTDLPIGIAIGVTFSIGLFVLMAIAPLIGDVKPPKNELETKEIAMQPPSLDEFEEPPEEPDPPEEPPPELEEPPPEISLDALDIALNPGTGGTLAGDFALPSVSASAGELGTEELIDFSDLDQPPSLLDKSPFKYPRSLTMKKVNGRVVVYIELDEQGNVTKAEVAESTLPQFNSFVVKEMSSRKFSAPSLQGRPVKARARLPINININ
ncbi:MAG: TonB family protein [Verrucomicrobiota bacterium]